MLGTCERGGALGVQHLELLAQFGDLGGELRALVVVYHLGKLALISDAPLHLGDLPVNRGERLVAGGIAGAQMFHLAGVAGWVAQRLHHGGPDGVINFVSHLAVSGRVYPLPGAI
ncbi:MAG TPA: hypothetical protein VGP82_11420 [Ktedonobacterales bacterium]|nr:hypothetical protein [Ktedonobacterales bacterium]